MTVQLTLVDAFTTRPFAGNPAAVCRLESFLPDDILQAIAREMNLSETAFVVHQDTGDDELRWFTPTTEVDLCGHATLATTHTLARSARYWTRSGLLTCTVQPDGWIELNFPANPPEAQVKPDGLDAAVGTDVAWFGVGGGRNRLALAILDSAPAVRALEPDFVWMAAQEHMGYVVSARGDQSDVDFVSRCFFPRLGILEDPVTGIAHCMLAPWWSEQLGRKELTGFQASRRGGTVGTRLEGDRVVLRGQAVTVGHVELDV